jgi:DNA-binding transcriptional regulator YdaS (Cro superfamily)
MRRTLQPRLLAIKHELLLTDLQLLLFNPPIMINEALERAVTIAGGQSHLARRIGGKVKQQHVHNWMKTGVVSPDHVITVAAAVDFQVTPHELDPKLYPNERDGLPAIGGAVSVADAPVTESVLGIFFKVLAPEDRAVFEREIAALSARGLRGEDLVTAMHGIAVQRGATFSLEELLAEHHAGRWQVFAERSAWTWMPEVLRLPPGSREVRDRQFAKARTKAIEPAPLGPDRPGTGAAA